jgi:hypothetical protein
VTTPPGLGVTNCAQAHDHAGATAEGCATLRLMPSIPMCTPFEYTNQTCVCDYTLLGQGYVIQRGEYCGPQ